MHNADDSLAPPPPPSPPLPRESSSTAVLALGLATLLFLALVAGGAYATYRLDMARTDLVAAAAASVVSPALPATSHEHPALPLSSPETTARTAVTRALGFGGFLNEARQAALQRDRAALDRAKRALETARVAAARLADTPGANAEEERWNLDSVIGLASTLATELEIALDPESPTVTSDALMALGVALAALPPLPSAVPVVVVESSATGSFAPLPPSAQALQDIRFWGLVLLMLVGLGPLGVGALLLEANRARSRQKDTALFLLMRSVESLATGDLYAPLWGLDRPDALGDLARALDRTRQRIGQIPDVTLMGENGPVPLKFEGESKTLFRALTQTLSEDYERVRKELSASAEALHQAEHTTITHEAAINRAVTALNESSKHLEHTHTATVEHLNDLVPYTRERADDLADVARILQDQVPRLLQTLVRSASETQELATRAHEGNSLLTAAAQTLADQLGTTSVAVGERIQRLDASATAVEERLCAVTDLVTQQVEKVQALTSRAQEGTEAALATQAAVEDLKAKTQDNADRASAALQAFSEHTTAVDAQTEATQTKLAELMATFGPAQESLAALAPIMDMLRTLGPRCEEALHESLARHQTAMDDAARALAGHNGATTEQIRTLADSAQNLLAASQTVQEAVTHSLSTLGILENQTTSLRASLESQITRLGQTVTRNDESLATHLESLGAALHQAKREDSTLGLRQAEALSEIASALVQLHNTLNPEDGTSPTQHPLPG